MSIWHIIMLSAGLVAASTIGSQAGPCSAEIYSVEARVDATLKAKAADGPTLQESREALLHRQPTPGSIAAARFQAIHHSGVNVARGLSLLFGLGTKALPSWDSKTRWNNLLGDLAVNVTAGSSGCTNSPHPSSREGHHSTVGRISGFLLWFLSRIAVRVRPPTRENRVNLAGV